MLDTFDPSTGEYYCNYWNEVAPGAGYGIKDVLSLTHLITLNVGNNDVLTTPRYQAAADVLEAGEKWQQYEDQITAALETGDINESLSNILSLMNGLGYYKEYVPALLARMEEGFEIYTQNMPKIIERLQSVKLVDETDPTYGPLITYGYLEYAEHPDIMLVGMFNPYKSDKLDVKARVISEAGEILVAKVNNFLKELAAQYDNCYYVDVTETESFAQVIGNADLGDDAHPTAAGHEFMAQQIINALPVYGTVPFVDVKETASYFESVKYVFRKGYMQGLTEDRFGPNCLMTREQLAYALYMKAGCPDVSALEKEFVDVPAQSMCHDAIIWAAENGLIRGITPALFIPNGYVTRAAMTKALYKLGGASTESDSYKQFRHSELIPSQYRDSISWAVDNAIMNGFADGFFHSCLGVTRSHAADILTSLWRG